MPSRPNCRSSPRDRAQRQQLPISGRRCVGAKVSKWSATIAIERSRDVDVGMRVDANGDPGADACHAAMTLLVSSLSRPRPANQDWWISEWADRTGTGCGARFYKVTSRLTDGTEGPPASKPTNHYEGTKPNRYRVRPAPSGPPVSMM